MVRSDRLLPLLLTEDVPGVLYYVAILGRFILVSIQPFHAQLASHKATTVGNVIVLKTASVRSLSRSLTTGDSVMYSHTYATS